jgi:hypothetical protein
MLLTTSVVLLQLFCDLLFSDLSGYILKNVQCTFMLFHDISLGCVKGVAYSSHALMEVYVMVSWI